MPVSLLVAGDLHLGRRSKHLPVGTSDEVSSPMQTWRRLVDEAVRREVDLVCLTGDVVDESNKYFEAFGPLIEGLRRLDREDIATFLVAGNHDFDVLAELVDQVNAPGVRLLGRNGVWEEAAFDHPETPLSIVGWSFPDRHVPGSPLANGPATRRSSRPTVGLLHCDLDAPESPYAPVAQADLAEAPVDCWLLGHIHKPGRHGEHPFTLYPGSPHALDNGEQGGHGAWLLTIRSRDRISCEQLCISPVRYQSVTADVSSVDAREAWRSEIVNAIDAFLSSSDVDQSYADLVMCDITLEGRTNQYERIGRWIDDPDIEEFSYDVGGTTARIYGITNATRPAIGDLDRLAGQDNPAGYLARVIRTLEEGEESAVVDDLLDALRPVFRKVERATTYAPLRSSRPLDCGDDAVSEQLLHRSRELLAVLVEQNDRSA